MVKLKISSTGQLDRTGHTINQSFVQHILGYAVPTHKGTESVLTTYILALMCSVFAQPAALRFSISLN